MPSTTLAVPTMTRPSRKLHGARAAWALASGSLLLFSVSCGSGNNATATNEGAAMDGGWDQHADVKDEPQNASDSAIDATDSQAPSCTPKTCADLGANCGSAPDDCGGVIECGSCPTGQTCGGGGANICGTDKCVPKSCIGLSAECGWASDGCSKAIDCGGCAPPESCGGGGQRNMCGCAPKSCAQLGASCGTLPDGCHGTITCGTCSQGQTCGGGGANQCGTTKCSPKVCSQLGASCGFVSDGCGEALNCGTCTDSTKCGGGGVANQCGCTPKTCFQLGASCGSVDTGCGKLDCGSCTAPDLCGGSGVASQCGCTCKLPNATTSCGNGGCSIKQCVPGFVDCDGQEQNGCEVNPSKDSLNCGACGKACDYPNASGVCSAGTCQLGTCDPGFGNCDNKATNGCEVATSSDPSNCGACGKVCSFANAVAACSTGLCSLAQCKAGFGNCDKNGDTGCEANLATDEANCGSCGKVCKLTNATATCTSGSCRVGQCKAGYGNCDANDANGCEATFATDKANCGSCGRTCSGTCTAGECEVTSGDVGRKWDQTYLGSGSPYNYKPEYDWMGYYTASNGVLKSAIGAPDQMFKDLAGATVLDIWVYMFSPHWYYYAGGTARIGVHGNSTQPGTFPGMNKDYSVNFARDEGKWVRLPTDWYDGFRSGSYRGITLHAGNSTAGQYYGYITANQTMFRWRYRK